MAGRVISSKNNVGGYGQNNSGTSLKEIIENIKTHCPIDGLAKGVGSELFSDSILYRD